MTSLAFLSQLVSTPIGIFDISVSMIVVGCVAALFIAITVNFLEANREPTQRERRSPVETGTMLLFFLAYYFVARLRIGELPPPPLPIHLALACISVAVITLGTCVNILGRRNLGKNWANQIKMYEHQTLVRSGPYHFVRHPLYASLIWMFFAGSLLYLNPILFLLTTLIFLPSMTWRAKQEEDLLEQTFPDYRTYCRTTGMFFPKLLRFRS